MGSKPCSGYCGGGLPEELQVLVDGFFEDTLVVAVNAKPFQGVFFISHGAYAVTLDALAAELGHVGRAGLHQRENGDVVDVLESLFEELVVFGRDAGGRRNGPSATALSR